jgi:rod shape-determining protein MreD
MLNLYVTLALLTGVTLLQSTVLPHLTLAGVAPDLMLLVIVSWSLLRGTAESIVWALIGGLMLDLTSGIPFGVTTVSLVLISVLTGLGEVNVFRANILLPGVTIAFATVAYYLAMLLLSQILGRPVAWGLSLFRLVGWAVLINSVTMPFVYLLLRWLHHRTSGEHIGW